MARNPRSQSDGHGNPNQQPSVQAALARLDLLADVALHKSRYFASSWASYDTATPGTLKLVPPPHRWAAVGEDYAQMRPMFMKEPPPFGDLMQQLTQAEQVLNQR